jgi:hypothetical protein
MTKLSLSSRLRFALRWALGHLAISVVVAGLVALFVFAVLYPSPWRQMLGVASIFAIVVVVDVTCGPLLTLVLASPSKSKRERWVDLSLVATIQLAALGYGLWSVYEARPVILAFEVDRFAVVTANEVQKDQMEQALPQFRSLPWAGVRLTGLRKAKSQVEYLEGIDQSIQGVSQSMRPSWWVPYSDVRLEVDKKAKPLAELYEKRPAKRNALDSSVGETGYPMKSLRFLPLASSKSFDWVVLLNESTEIVGYAQVDAFD